MTVHAGDSAKRGSCTGGRHDSGPFVKGISERTVISPFPPGAAPTFDETLYPESSMSNRVARGVLQGRCERRRARASRSPPPPSRPPSTDPPPGSQAGEVEKEGGGGQYLNPIAPKRLISSLNKDGLRYLHKP